MHVARNGRAGAVLFAVLMLLAALPSIAGAESDPIFDEPDAATDEVGFPDPFERANRVTFRMNMSLDRWVVDPLARAYAFVVPAPGRRAVRRALANINSPSVFVNDILQLEPLDALVTATRFVVNTTVGIVGFLDPAEKMGLEPHHSDFGQTLALMGMPSGPFLILPAIGPSTARDATGYVVDLFFQPVTYLLGPGVPVFFSTHFFGPSAQLLAASVQQGGIGLTAREAHADELRALEASSMDYYAALRSAYFQDRTAQIWARREGRGTFARGRSALRSLSLGGTGGEVGNLPAHDGDQPVEAVALEY